MILVAVVDDRMGLCFHGRRQSQDKRLREKILTLFAGKTLWMNGYSAKQFAKDAGADAICVAEDFLTIGEGAGIIGQYTLHFPAMFFVGIALIAAGTIVLHRWARGRVPKKRWWLRVLALVLIVLLGFGAWELWYGNTDLYDSMMEANTSLFNVWKDAENYASKGFVYSFLNSLAEAMPQKPDGYSARKAEDLLSAYPEADIPEGQRVAVFLLFA